MSEQKTAYSSEVQQFRALVQTAMFQAAADARKLAERTGTKLVIRERPQSDDERKGEHIAPDSKRFNYDATQVDA